MQLGDFRFLIWVVFDIYGLQKSANWENIENVVYFFPVFFEYVEASNSRRGYLYVTVVRNLVRLAKS